MYQLTYGFKKDRDSCSAENMTPCTRLVAVVVQTQVLALLFEGMIDVGQRSTSNIQSPSLAISCIVYIGMTYIYHTIHEARTGAR
jgi:hypothetical protein